ncbi:MAG: glycosyltransferase family 2 protein [Oscillospiraceae bacterium]|nr:glycosyltransferase family 2 protein [Oscillospiraceae bacterium]
MKDSTLYIVIPCYNEEEVLVQTSSEMEILMDRMMSENLISQKSKVMFVDDGSKDTTWSIIQSLCKENSLFSGVKLSRNRGHQNALLAGLAVANKYADMTVSIDADLQDDINAIEEMVVKYHGGADIVYGVRGDRRSDSFAKKTTAVMFYKVMKMMGADTVYNHADCRLMSRRALSVLLEFDEVNLYLRGMVPLVGFPTDTVVYERKSRMAGESKYPLKAMIKLAVNGITSMSVKPLNLIFSTGIVVLAVSILLLLISVCRADILQTLAIISSVFIVGGLQLIAIGIVGEYVGKTYSETKHRPKFIISDIILDEEVQ